jgi:hypothetical protein
MDRRYEASGSDPLRPPSQVPHGPWSIFWVGCLTLAVGVAALMIGTCATVGVIAWRSGIFDSPPELPALGRPLNAEELSNTEVFFDIRDDFVGPRVREIVFGTQTSPDEQLPILAERYRARGWDRLPTRRARKGTRHLRVVARR